MADFRNGYVLTDAGKVLQAKLETGATLKLTRMVLGSGAVDSADDYRTKTALVRPEQSMVIKSKTQTGKICTCVATVTSDAVETGFSASELGLYAMDGENEILYAVSYDESPAYVPGKNDGVAVESTFELAIAFGDNVNIEIIIPKTQEEIIEMVQNYAAKSIEAAANAKTSETNAADAANRTEKNMQNAALSEANAKASEESAKNTADFIAENTKADVKTATEQAKAAADSAQSAAEAERTAQELYQRWCADIVGPPAAAMAKADLFVAPGAAAMAAMGR